jgi:hypothetical protein
MLYRPGIELSLGGLAVLLQARRRTPGFPAEQLKLPRIFLTEGIGIAVPKHCLFVLAAARFLLKPFFIPLLLEKGKTLFLFQA